jgi:hypothetical protein
MFFSLVFGIFGDCVVTSLSISPVENKMFIIKVFFSFKEVYT